MILLSNITALLLGIAIAAGIALLSKKRHIGMGWSFYFSLLSPLLGFFLTIVSNKKVHTRYSLNIVVKGFLIVSMLYGAFLWYGALTTNKNSAPFPKTTYHEEYEKINKEELLKTANGRFIDQASIRLGRVLGGGILSLIVSEEVYALWDYRTKMYFRFYAGLLLLSVGGFLLRHDIRGLLMVGGAEKIGDLDNSKQQVNTTQTELYLQLRRSAIYKKIIANINYLRYAGISTIIGLILGWHFRIPNNKFLEILFGNYESIEKKNMTILFYKNQSYFSTEFFSFNWSVFLSCSLLCFALILFFYDKPLRILLYKKISFSEEKKEIKS